MSFYFAWVEPTNTNFLQAFARNDEQIVGFEVSHAEGDFPSATLDLRNPRVGLLNPGRKQWAWLSWDGDNASSAGAEPLFFGRLVGVPSDIQENIVRLTFIGRPSDYDAQKRALAAAIKVRPYWDPIWHAPDRRDDPDVALEARPQLWHINRLTHAVTVSDILAGEDGTVSFTSADIIHDSMNISYGEAPLRRVAVTADVLWNQQASGTVDVTKELVAAFDDAGTSESNMVSSYTGQGLGDDWPEEDDDIGGGWTIGAATLTPADGTILSRAYKSVTVKYETVPESNIGTATAVPFKIKFPRWRFLPYLPVVYEASRSRSETLNFEMHADVQAMISDESETELLQLAFSSAEISELVDGESSNASMPIEDLRRRQYFPTDRGQQSIEYLISLARTRLLTRARTVQIDLETSFTRAADLSCRMSATIYDDRLPSGIAVGKIVGYGFACDGDTGALTGSVRVACSIGQGNSIAALTGNPVYVVDGVLEDGIQQREGQTVMPIAGAVTYQPLLDAPSDDGVDFFNMTPENVIESFIATNGVAVQDSVLSGSFVDIAQAVEALNAVHTTVALILVPVAGGPFEYTYNMTVSDLMVPKTIDLEAA